MIIDVGGTKSVSLNVLCAALTLRAYIALYARIV